MALSLYHGTYAHAVSHLRASERGFFGRGVYLSTCRADASQYGDRLAEVHIDVHRPFHTTADFAVAEAFDCDTPAGPMILEVLGADDAAALMIDLSHTEDGFLNEAWSVRLQAMGYDSICAKWPDGLAHWIVFDPEQVCVLRWMSMDEESEPLERTACP